MLQEECLHMVQMDRANASTYFQGKCMLIVVIKNLTELSQNLPKFHDGCLIL